MPRLLALTVLAAIASGCSSTEKPPPSNLGKIIACTMKVQGEWGFWLIYTQDGLQKRIAGCTDPGPDWSPDGNEVSWSDGTKVRIMRLDGREPRALAGGPGWAPTWSPDGKSIAFGTLNSIQSREVDGANARVWTVADVACEHPTWSPNGLQLAVTDSRGDLVITDGKSEKRFPLNGARHPDWSPDGKRILLDAPDGAIRAFMVESGEIVAVGNARGSDPSWLRDGKSFLTVWLGSGDEAPSVYEWDAEGRLGTRLTSRDEVRDAAGNW